MARVSMLDLETLNGTRLQPLVERALQERAPDPGFFAVMGHNQDIAAAMYEFWMNTFTSGVLGPHIKEAIRVKLSRLAECHY